MSVAVRRPMRLAEFLAWEERQELRYEFDGFAPVAMTGGSLNHDEITGNLRAAIKARLAGGPCRVFGPNVKILANDHVRYPDALVTCTPQDGRASIVAAPVIVFDVLSPGSSRTDRIEKSREYFATASILRYVILEQDSAAATVLIRDGAAWRALTVAGAETLDLPEIAVTLPLDEIYADVAFPEVPAA